MDIGNKIDKLHTLLEDMIEMEEYQLCHQIKGIIDRYHNIERERRNHICPKCSNLMGEDGICWKCLTQ